MNGGTQILTELQRCFRLNISEGPSYRLIHWVQSGELALAIATEPEYRVQLDRLPIWNEPLFLVRAKVRGAPATMELEDLRHKNLFRTTRLHPERIYLDHKFETHGMKPSIELEIEPLPSLLTVIASNDTKSIMPLSVFMEEYDRGLLNAS